ncbi:MAG: hypothetical protein AMXMBFR56_39170 [Polyangiaceae bacterium]
MREIRSPGSVRGAARKGRPYRDQEERLIWRGVMGWGGEWGGSLSQVQEPAQPFANSTEDGRWQSADELIQVRLVHGGDL